MDETTRARLNAINRRFYAITAQDFDASRWGAWAGWEQLLPHIRNERGTLPRRVLDVGCGNGRFGLFLAAHANNTLVYHGIDNNTALLARARDALATRADITATFDVRDVVMGPPDSGMYDLVALFGVIHHIPGTAQREAFMRTLAQRVAPGGFLVFTAWRFYEYERFRARLVPWPEDITVERHDYLLDWQRGETALRYCHYVDDAEHTRLIEATELESVADYRADGRTGDMNRYSALKRV